MSYLDRLRECRYRSPSGIEFTAHFDDAGRTSSKKLAINELPQQDTPDVQDLGDGTNDYTMNLYFTGPDYDTIADAFWTALEERGAGILFHPRWGDIPVMPQSRSQREDFVNGARQAVFTVQFIRVSVIENYPLTSAGSATSVANAVSSASVSATDEFAKDFQIKDARDRVSIIDKVKNGVETVSNAINDIAAATDEANEQFNQIVRDVTATADELVNAPANLASSIIRLVRTPARVQANVRNKLRGYTNLYNNIISMLLNEVGTSGQAQTSSLFLTAIGLATAEAAVTDNGETQTREQVAYSALQLSQIRDGIVSNINTLEESIEDYFYSPEIARTLREQLTTAIAILYERGFGLALERIEVLDHDTTPLNFVYRVYGSIDRLEEWIKQNELMGDEHFLIQKGQEVRYYE